MIILQLLELVLFILAGSANKYKKKWNLHGKSGEGYYLATEIGTPPQKFNLLLDTGSSNLAIAGFSSPRLDSYYNPEESNSSFSYNETDINVSYFQGSWKGYLARDIFSIPDIDVEAILTDVAVIKTAQGFYVNNSHWQGILGLAYKAIAKPNGMVVPWFDLVSELHSEKNTFSLELCGSDFSSQTEEHYGSFSIGDKNCFLSNYSTAIFREGFYEVLITELHIGGEKVAIPCVELNSPRTIIDSGTTDLQLPTNIYKLVIEELKQKTEQNGTLFPSEFWYNRGVICLMLSSKEWLKFPYITIYFNNNDGFQFGSNIPPNSYLRKSLGASNNTHVCVYLGIEQSHVGTVLGAVVLEGFCLRFDRAQKRIYFSETDCGPDVNILKLYNSDKEDCSFVTTSGINGPLIASCIILILITLPLLMTVTKWGYQQVLHRRIENSEPFISLSDGVT